MAHFVEHVKLADCAGCIPPVRYRSGSLALGLERLAVRNNSSLRR